MKIGQYRKSRKYTKRSSGDLEEHWDRNRPSHQKGQQIGLVERCSFLVWKIVQVNENECHNLDVKLINSTLWVVQRYKKEFNVSSSENQNYPNFSERYAVSN